MIFVPFADGKPAGAPVDVLTGFLDGDGNALRPPGRVSADGKRQRCWSPTMSATAIWRVSATRTPASRRSNGVQATPRRVGYSEATPDKPARQCRLPLRFRPTYGCTRDS